MAAYTKEEFGKIYKEKIEPSLADLEKERIEAQSKVVPFWTLGGVGIAVSFLIMVFYGFASSLPIDVMMKLVMWGDKGLVIILIPTILTGYSFFIAWNIISEFRTKLKKELISKLISLYGDMYLSRKKDLINLSDIQNMGLFRLAGNKKDDDIVIGVHNKLNFSITETRLISGDEDALFAKRAHIVFRGIILKVQMNKNFTGKTVVGAKGYVNKPDSTFDKIELEFTEFMKNREIYSTDQIEARYILTTSFMERVADVGKVFFSYTVSELSAGFPSLDAPVMGSIPAFDPRTTISAAFVDGYAYIFVPLYDNFFEIPINKTLYDENTYYTICTQLDSIMSMIKYLHLDDKTGL